jgi:hypothetical protein
MFCQSEMMYCLECDEWTPDYRLEHLRRHARRRHRERAHTGVHHLFESRDKAEAWKSRPSPSNGTSPTDATDK